MIKILKEKIYRNNEQETTTEAASVFLISVQPR